MYEGERSNTTGKKPQLNATTTWVGKIGLIYPSDFGYAGVNCGDYIIKEYNNANSCGKTRNWLTLSSSHYWTISPYSTFGSVPFFVISKGYVDADDARDVYGIRPTTYLKSDVEIIGGDGDNKPYKLAKVM